MTSHAGLHQVLCVSGENSECQLPLPFPPSLPPSPSHSSLTFHAFYFLSHPKHTNLAPNCKLAARVPEPQFIPSSAPSSVKFKIPAINFHAHTQLKIYLICAKAEYDVVSFVLIFHSGTTGSYLNRCSWSVNISFSAWGQRCGLDLTPAQSLSATVSHPLNHPLLKRLRNMTKTQERCLYARS